MAASYSWGVTNNTALANISVSPIDLKLVQNYAVREDENGVCVLTNLTSPVDQTETVTIKAMALPQLKLSTPVAVPYVTQNAIQFSIKTEDVLKITDTADLSYRADIPIKVTLTVAAGSHAAITSDRIMTVIARALGALYYTDGTSRIPAYMKLATQPGKN